MTSSSTWISAARAIVAIILTVTGSAIMLIVYLDPEQPEPALALIVAGGSLILALLGIDLGPWVDSVLGRTNNSDTDDTDDTPPRAYRVRPPPPAHDPYNQHNGHRYDGPRPRESHEVGPAEDRREDSAERNPNDT